MNYNIDNYHLKSPVASFLPGIAGRNGTPLWCFYVNRGQCVAAFGHSDKDHPILEFRPADQAYLQTGRLGFRTFIRFKDGKYWEPFGEERERGLARRNLTLECAEIRLTDEWEGCRAAVRYASLPGKPYSALLRCLDIKNTSSQTRELEILDGLPRIVPSGIDDAMLKTMSTTAAAWIETIITNPEIPLFRIRASMTDSFEVRPVQDCHFMAAVLNFDGKDMALKPIVDATALFGNDYSFVQPDNFIEKGMAEVNKIPPVLLGRYPSGFSGASLKLKPEQNACIYSIFGYIQSVDDLILHASDWQSAQWFNMRFDENRKCVEECLTPFQMHTAMPNLDSYTVQTALDNTLRGGMPIVWNMEGQSRCYHIYGRKHGDLERDYNDFALPSVRYSAGFGNYRDMNQNRRIDVFINPETGDSDIHLFMDLIQPDGYNPLIVNPGGFILPEDKLQELKSEFPALKTENGEPMHPGQLLDAGVPEEQFAQILAQCEYIPSATFGEGYWTDHWTYNLDLIDQYLRIFPENEANLLFGKADYRWFSTEGVRIRPLEERFRLEGDSIQPQNHLIETATTPRFLSCRSTLFEKLFTLAVVKCATLGYEERGLEMEAGRPGWCDALNGLPGLFGSSLVDSAELLRLLRMLCRFSRLIDRNHPVNLFQATWQLMEDLKKAKTLSDKHERWLARWLARDTYRSAIYDGPQTNIRGELHTHFGSDPETEIRSISDILEFLKEQESSLSSSLNTASQENRGILPAYYRFEVDGWTKLENGYTRPERLVRKKLPLYLEAAVKQMKLLDSQEAKKDLHFYVKCSPLYDRKLGMYVLNDTLNGQPETIGRARAFPDGWLENGSVWLHMEYKYLLELLRIGDGHLFWAETRRLLIPFLNPDIYGRSIYENSSFIAPSSYPVASVHGRGFVGRLTGATAEYLTIWSEFLLGSTPFILKPKGLVFRPSPLLPAWLFRKDGSLEFYLFGSVKVRYENPDRIDIFTNTWRIETIKLRIGKEEKCFKDYIPSSETTMLRLKQVTELCIVFRRK